MTRWTPKRKAAVLQSIIDGKITRDEALRLHGLTHGELSEWGNGFINGGLRGLKVNLTRESTYKPRYVHA